MLNPNSNILIFWKMSFNWDLKLINPTQPIYLSIFCDTQQIQDIYPRFLCCIIYSVVWESRGSDRHVWDDESPTCDWSVFSNSEVLLVNLTQSYKNRWNWEQRSANHLRRVTTCFIKKKNVFFFKSWRKDFWNDRLTS